jgi:hypothetical protein
MDVPANPSGDETIGNSTASVHLLNDGRIGWDDLATLNIHTSVRPVLAYDAVGYFQRLDTVTTLDGAGTLAVTNIGAPSTITVFLTSPDGTRTVIRGEADVDGNLASSPEDPDVVIVDGRVRIQVGQPIPGTAITPTGISQTFVAANNDWYARGSVTTPASAWAVRNGSLLAKTGDPIGADTWSTTFNALTGNSNGDWAMIGKTSNANPAIDDVLAVNGQVVLREGDPIPFDIDNNGTLDTAYIGRGVNTNAAFASIHSLGLAADGTIYVLAYLHDAGGIDLAASGTPVALLRITQTPDCPADFNDSGAVTVQDIFDFLAAYFTQNPSADFNNSGGVTVQDIFDFLGAYFTGCP